VEQREGTQETAKGKEEQGDCVELLSPIGKCSVPKRGCMAGLLQFPMDVFFNYKCQCWSYLSYEKKRRSG
jgi:hypothetical protein